MKLVKKLAIILSLISCGNKSDLPFAKKDGIQEYTEDTNQKNLTYSEVPASMWMVWYPDQDYFNSNQPRLNAMGFKDVNSMRKACLSGIPKNSLITYNALETFFGELVTRKTAIAKYKYVIEESMKANAQIMQSMEDSDCEKNKSDQCNEMQEQSNELLSSVNESKIKIQAEAKELQIAQKTYKDINIKSLMDSQIYCDGAVDWKNTPREQLDEKKINLIYPLFSNTYKNAGYRMVINSVEDFEIEFTEHGPEKINYSSRSGDFKIISIDKSSNKRNVVVLDMYEKDVNEEKTGAIIRFTLVENKIFGFLRYEGEMKKLVKGKSVKQGACKFEFAAN